jgi:hypothetical protein
MDKNEKQELITALKNGTVQVTFQKVNSDEIRVMPCTLNPIVLEAHNVKPTIGGITSDSDQIPAWSIDKQAWRSFIADTVLGWEVL